MPDSEHVHELDRDALSFRRWDPAEAVGLPRRFARAVDYDEIALRD